MFLPLVNLEIYYLWSLNFGLSQFTMSRGKIFFKIPLDISQIMSYILFVYTK